MLRRTPAMSMLATFVQVEPTELARLQANPDLAEALFQDEPPVPPVFARLNETMQARVRAAGPRYMADTLQRLPPDLRERLEKHFGASTAAFAGGAGGDRILEMMEQRAQRHAHVSALATAQRPRLSLDKAWH